MFQCSSNYHAHISMHFFNGLTWIFRKDFSKLFRVLRSSAAMAISVCWVPPPVPPLVGESYSAFGNMTFALRTAWSNDSSYRAAIPWQWFGHLTDKVHGIYDGETCWDRATWGIDTYRYLLYYLGHPRRAIDDNELAIWSSTGPVINSGARKRP